MEPSDPPVPVLSPDVADARPLLGLRVLVAEDDYLLASDLRDELEGQDARVLGPVPTAAEAFLRLGEGPRPDAAILNVNLGGEMAYPLADALRAQGIPFVFATGYDAWSIPDAYAEVTRFEKPVEAGQSSWGWPRRPSPRGG
jgi:CheY-like chemotaxis protein